MCVDKKVGYGLSIALERRKERVEGCRREFTARAANGGPPRTVVPIGVAGVGVAATVGVEIQVRRQLVPHATIGVRATHLLGGIRERRSMCGHPVVSGCSVAIEVMADRVELRQCRNLDKTVIVGIVINQRFRGRRGFFCFRTVGTGGNRGGGCAGQRSLVFPVVGEGHPDLCRLGFHHRKLNLDAVGDLAFLLAHDGFDLVGVALAGVGGRFVEIAHRAVPGVGHQGGHVVVAHGAQYLVAGHGGSVHLRPIPTQHDARAVVSGPRAEGGWGRRRGRRRSRRECCRRRGRHLVGGRPVADSV